MSDDMKLPNESTRPLWDKIFSKKTTRQNEVPLNSQEQKADRVEHQVLGASEGTTTQTQVNLTKDIHACGTTNQENQPKPSFFAELVSTVYNYLKTKLSRKQKPPVSISAPFNVQRNSSWTNYRVLDKETKRNLEKDKALNADLEKAKAQRTSLQHNLVNSSEEPLPLNPSYPTDMLELNGYIENLENMLPREVKPELNDEPPRDLESLKNEIQALTHQYNNFDELNKYEINKLATLREHITSIDTELLEAGKSIDPEQIKRLEINRTTLNVQVKRRQKALDDAKLGIGTKLIKLRSEVFKTPKQLSAGKMLEHEKRGGRLPEPADKNIKLSEGKMLEHINPAVRLLVSEHTKVKPAEGKMPENEIPSVKLSLVSAQNQLDAVQYNSSHPDAEQMPLTSGYPKDVESLNDLIKILNEEKDAHMQSIADFGEEEVKAYNQLNVRSDKTNEQLSIELENELVPDQRIEDLSVSIKRLENQLSSISEDHPATAEYNPEALKQEIAEKKLELSELEKARLPLTKGELKALEAEHEKELAKPSEKGISEERNEPSNLEFNPILLKDSETLSSQELIVQWDKTQSVMENINPILSLEQQKLEYHLELVEKEIIRLTEELKLHADPINPSREEKAIQNSLAAKQNEKNELQTKLLELKISDLEMKVSDQERELETVNQQIKDADNWIDKALEGPEFLIFDDLMDTRLNSLGRTQTLKTEIETELNALAKTKEALIRKSQPKDESIEDLENDDSEEAMSMDDLMKQLEMGEFTGNSEFTNFMNEHGEIDLSTGKLEISESLDSADNMSVEDLMSRLHHLIEATESSSELVTPDSAIDSSDPVDLDQLYSDLGLEAPAKDSSDVDDFAKLFSDFGLEDPNKAPGKTISAEELVHYIEQDKKVIDGILARKGYNTLLDYAQGRRDSNKASGKYIKISRAKFPELSHSYRISPEGTLEVVLHKTSKGSSQPADERARVLGGGGFKTAKTTGEGKVRARIRDMEKFLKEAPYAIEASHKKEFTECEYLLVGDYSVNKSYRKKELISDFDMPEMNAGSMEVRMEDQPFTPKETAALFLQAAKGLKVMHDNQWIHRDIKPDNIFCGVNGEAKLADFDLVMPVNDDTTPIEAQGTPGYISPELLQGECYGIEGGKQNDIFSFGASILRTAGLDIYDDFFAHHPNATEPDFYIYMADAGPNGFLNEIESICEEYAQNNPEMASLIKLALPLVSSPAQRPNIDEVISGLEREKLLGEMSEFEEVIKNSKDSLSALIAKNDPSDAEEIDHLRESIKNDEFVLAEIKTDLQEANLNSDIHKFEKAIKNSNDLLSDLIANEPSDTEGILNLRENIKKDESVLAEIQEDLREFKGLEAELIDLKEVNEVVSNADEKFKNGTLTDDEKNLLKVRNQQLVALANKSLEKGCPSLGHIAVNKLFHKSKARDEFMTKLA